MKINFIRILLLSALFGFLAPFKALAVCPLCTIAVGAGVGLSRYLGIDDIISGIWIGALVLSLSLWAIDWLNQKNIRYRLILLATVILMYGITIVPLKMARIIGHPLNLLFGIDRLLVGIGLGSIVFLISAFLNNWLKKKNNGRVYFPYQKVVVPIASLVIISIAIYLIIIF